MEAKAARTFEPIDTPAVVARIDLAEYAARDTTLRRTGRNEWHGPCPFCAGRDRFMVKGDPWRFWCRQCDRKGDAIRYVMERDGVDFRSACQTLGASASEMGETSQRTRLEPEPEREEPPSLAWQERGQAFVAEAHRTLMSDVGTLARTYLHDKRGLTNATLEAWRIGLQPSDVREPGEEWAAGEQPVFIPRGVVVPWYGEDEGTLWGIRIRRAHAPTPKDRFHSIRESRQPLYGAMTVVPGQPALLTESELDAILCWQVIGDQMATLAAGSARASFGIYGLRAFAMVSRLVVMYDADEAGDEAWSRVHRYGSYMTRRSVPEGKDPCGYRQAKGDLEGWLYGLLRGCQVVSRGACWQCGRDEAAHLAEPSICAAI